MLPHIIIDDNSVQLIPAEEQLRKQARFLRNHCSIPLGHAQEMVAYLYHFPNWSKLISRPSTETDKEISLQLVKMRNTLQQLRNNITKNELSMITKWNALPGTLTEAIENNKISQLNDLDTFRLYNCLHDDVYWGEPTPVSWLQTLKKIDRCLVLLAKSIPRNKKSKTINPHIYFSWYGLRMYGYLSVEQDKLTYDCRELDSYLYSSEENYNISFKRPWFIPYIIGFICHLLNSFNNSSYSGSVSFSRVSNEGLIEKAVAFKGDKIISKRYSCNGNEYTDIPISELVNAMLEIGGVIDDTRQCIVFSVGNGIVY